MNFRRALLFLCLLLILVPGCWLGDLQKNVQVAEEAEAAKESRYSQEKQKALAVKDADEHMVVSCSFLQTVSGTSNVAYLYGAHRIEEGLEKAAQRARLAAADLNATHVVWSARSGPLDADRPL